MPNEKDWKCPPHHWIINSENVGHCKFCPAVKDFGKLQRRFEREVSENRVKRKPKGRRRKHKPIPQNVSADYEG